MERPRVLAIALASAVGLCLGAFVSCGPQAPKCGPASCDGCCRADGSCALSNTPFECGLGGVACSACPTTQTCVLGVCIAPATGGGGGATGGGGGATGGGGGGGTGGGSGGGAADGGVDGGAPDAGTSGFDVVVLDPNARGADYLAAAFNPVLRRVGVVYYSARATQTMPGVDDFDLKYVEWRDGALQPIETIRVVQRKVGLAIAFHPVTGEPTVAYLGGTPGFIQGMPVYWYQSDAVINRRNNGTWTETIIASTGADVTCGNPVSDRGFLVGLWPTLAYDSTGKLYFAYRDAHDAQFPQQDWAGSDIELWEGVPPNLTGTCVKAGGNDKQAWGGHLRLVLTANSQPALVSDQMFGTADTGGSNVAFQEKLAGTWSSPSFLLSAANTQSGATPAWDPQEGLGVAVIDRTTNDLLYLRRPPGSTTWAAPDPVFGTGSGGWYPSLAMDPVLHEPAIAFAVCSPRVGVTETNCLASEDDLRVAQRVAGLWRSTVVDTNGGYLPQLGFFVSGSGPGASARRVVVYRQPPALDGAGLPVSNVGELKVAIER